MPGGHAVKHLCQELHTECGLFSNPHFDAWGDQMQTDGPPGSQLAKISQQSGRPGPRMRAEGGNRSEASPPSRSSFFLWGPEQYYSAKVLLQRLVSRLWPSRYCGRSCCGLEAPFLEVKYNCSVPCRRKEHISDCFICSKYPAD